jgi:hypothetical protein
MGGFVMIARRVQTDTERLEAVLTVTAASEVYIAVIHDAVKWVAAIEKFLRDPSSASTGEELLSRPLPGGDDARYSLIVMMDADDVDDADFEDCARLDKTASALSANTTATKNIRLKPRPKRFREWKNCASVSYAANLSRIKANGS